MLQPLEYIRDILTTTDYLSGNEASTISSTAMLADKRTLTGFVVVPMVAGNNVALIIENEIGSGATVNISAASIYIQQIA